MAKAVLTISSRNYSSWSLRGWLLCKMAGIDFKVDLLPAADADARAELLHLSPSFLVPVLTHGKIRVWDTLAIAEYLNEAFPDAHILPADLAKRTRCRSVSGEMHQGFYNLRSALPMNLKAHFPRFKVFSGATADIARIATIWHECLTASKGPYLFGKKPTVADAMFAPVCTRFKTYDVPLDELCSDYCAAILSLPEMIEWKDLALDEPDAVDELEAEF